MANTFDTQLFLKNYENQKQRQPQAAPTQREVPSFDADRFLQNYEKQRGVIPQAPAVVPQETQGGGRNPLQMVTDPGANPWLNVVDRDTSVVPDTNEPVRQFTLPERLQNINTSFQIALENLKLNTMELGQTTNEALRETPLGNLMPKEPLITLPIKTQAEEELKRLTQDFVATSRGDIELNSIAGVLNGAQYLAENIAASAPAMGAILASGGTMAPLTSVTAMAGEVNAELQQMAPEVSAGQRAAMSWAAGSLMGGLEIVGVGTVFKGVAPKQVASMAVVGKLVDFLQQRGIKPAAARVAQAAIVEGSTELTQEAILMITGAAAGGEYGREQVTFRLKEALFAGATVGAGIRAGVEVIKPRTRDMEDLANLDAIDDEDLGIEPNVPQLTGPGAAPLALPAPAKNTLPAPAPNAPIVTPSEASGPVIYVGPELSQIEDAEFEDLGPVPYTDPYADMPPPDSPIWTATRPIDGVGDGQNVPNKAPTSALLNPLNSPPVGGDTQTGATTAGGTTLTYVGPKPGSNPGGMYKDDAGLDWIVKEYDDPKQAYNEGLAQSILLSYDITKAVIAGVGQKDGKPIYHGLWRENLVPFDPNGYVQKKAVQQDFAFHAWLANWDVVGQDYDNISFSPAGTPIYTDMGGALSYRAQGAPKGSAFGSTVSELETLRDAKINPQAAKVFGDLDDVWIASQILNLYNKFHPYGENPDRLTELILSVSDPDGSNNKLTYSEANNLLHKLVERLFYMKDWADKVLVPKQITPQSTSVGYASVVKDAMKYHEVSNSIVYSYSSDMVVSKTLADPHIKALMESETYVKWATGNKIWWNPEMKSLVFGNYQEGWMPGILFHGTHVNPVFNTETNTWHFYPMYNPKYAGENAGGDDTKSGMFLTDNPKIAAIWGKGNEHQLKSWVNSREQLLLSDLTKVKVMPLVTSLKNPLVYDYGGGDWNGQKNIQLAQYAKAHGYDSVVTLNVSDNGGKQTQIIVMEPSAKLLKSPYSMAFDPRVNTFHASVGGVTFEQHSLTTEEYQKLRAAMREWGLGDVPLRTFQPGQFGKAQALVGKTGDGLFIGIATEIDSKYGYIGELRHEAIHTMKELGVFKTPKGQKMWRVLEREAKRQGIPDAVKQNYAQHEWLEETIANMAAAHKASPQKGPLGAALDRVVNFFKALVNWGRGLGFQSAEDVYQYLFGGSKENLVWRVATMSPETTKVEESLDQVVAASKKLGVNANTGKADYYNRMVRFGWNVIQLAKKNTHIQWLQEYVQHAARWHAEKMQWMAQANETVKKWNALTPEMQDQLAAFIFDVEQMKYRTPAEVQKGVVRKPTKAEFQSLAKAHKLNSEAAKVYLQVRNDFDTFLKEIEQTALNEIARAYPTDQIQRELEQLKAKNEFADLRRKPYFPHARFGLFTIIVKDAKNKTVYMESFDSVKERNRAIGSVKKKFPADHKTSASQLSEEGAIFQGMPYSLLEILKNNLNLSAKQQADLDQLLIQASPAMSFKNHFVRRKNIAGYSNDALRAYSDYFWHGANHIARIKYKPLLEGSIQAGKDDIAQTYMEGDVDSTKRVQINDHLHRHLDQIMSPENDWAALRSIGFLWWLGFNVKSAVLNFTQVPMVTQSYLGAHYGDARSATALTKAMREFQAMWRTPEKQLARTRPEDFKLVDLGIKMGFLDESFAMELAGLAEGHNLLSRRMGSKARKAWIGFNHAAGAMFQAVEKANRRITFMAAVELARKQPDSLQLQTLKREKNLIYADLLKDGFPDTEAMAFLAGWDAVNSTQFEYSSWARPEVMTGKVRSTVLTFFMFTQNMLWFIQNSPGNTRYLAMLLLFAGIKGLPGAEDLEELAKGVGAMLHKDWNMEKELREQIIELVGPDGPNPDLFLHGISRYGFGLPLLADMTGLPLPSVDMSANVSMGSPVPIVSPTLQAFGKGMQGKDFKDTLAELTQESAGPTLGIPIGIAEMLANSSYGWKDQKRWEPAMPAAASSLSKAYRYYYEGEERSASGARVLEYEREDPTHMAEMIAQGLGFNTTRKSQTWNEIIMKSEAGQFWTIRRGLLLDQLDRARQKSPEDVKTVQAAIRRYNGQAPHPELRIPNTTIERSRKGRETSRAKQEAGLPNANMLRPVYEEIHNLFPENKSEPSERIESAPSGR